MVMDDPPTDAAVIEASLTDARRFGEIFDRHAADIRRFLMRRTDPDSAASLLSEVFCVAFERRHTYQLDRPNARPWLFGIGSNLLLKHYRTETRRIRATGRAGGTRSEPRAFEDDVDASIDAARLWPAVADAVSSLPDIERQTLLLFAWEDLSYAEISEALDVPVGTVRSRINRARQRIRELVPNGRGEHGDLRSVHREVRS